MAKNDTQHEVEQLLYRQAELLDGKQWQEWIDLFTPDGMYWMPPEPSHTTWDGMPAIFAAQDLQCLHRIRRLAIHHRTAQVNQIRGLLQEYGIEIRKGRTHVRKQIPLILEDANNELSAAFRELLQGLYEELVHLDERILNYDRKIDAIADQRQDTHRLLTIPGIGPITATALVASIGSIDAFKNGRELAAWLGLVPRQHSTGGKPRLLGISKRGDTYLRQLLIHGARSRLRLIDKKTDRCSRWANNLVHRRNKNIAAVALANKMARTVFAVLKRQEDYRWIQDASSAVIEKAA